MVRFSWHVEDGLSAFVPVGGLQADKEAPGVQHADCDIEVRVSDALQRLRVTH